jgi:hypothetical protein
LGGVEESVGEGGGVITSEGAVYTISKIGSSFSSSGV